MLKVGVDDNYFEVFFALFNKLFFLFCKFRRTILFLRIRDDSFFTAKRTKENEKSVCIVTEIQLFYRHTVESCFVFKRKKWYLRGKKLRSAFKHYGNADRSRVLVPVPLQYPKTSNEKNHENESFFDTLYSIWLCVTITRKKKEA